MVDFDPSKIYDSLIKETLMSEDDAKNITELSVRRIISSGIKFLSGPHIREVVCSILSEQHFENERKLYTRIGMPLMDYEAILEKGLKVKEEETLNPESIHHWAANRIAEEYAHLRILNSEESKAHLYGDIYIHNLKHFDLRPVEQVWDPRIVLKYGIPPVSSWTHCSKSGPAGTLRVAVNHLAKWLGMTQGEFSGAQGYNYISMFLAPYVKGLDDKDINQAIQSLIFEINQLSAVIGREIPITSISYSPSIIETFSNVPAIGPYGKIDGVYGDYSEDCLRIFNALNKTYKIGDYHGKPFDYPQQLLYFTDEWLNVYDDAYSNVFKEIETKHKVIFINLCADWLCQKITTESQNKKYLNRGILQTISLNLPRYAFISKDEEEFLEIIEDTMNLCSDILKKKHNIIQKRLKSNHLPICSGTLDEGPLFDFDSQYLAISFIGLNEAVKSLTGNYLNQLGEASKLGVKTVKAMYEYCNKMSKRDNMKYILQESRSDIPTNRFASLDLKHFPKTAIPQKDEKGVYYSNSTHFLSQDLDFNSFISIQGEFHKIIQNGVIEKIPSNYHQWSQDKIREDLSLICKKSSIGSVIFTE
jgi:ribonucleoside-triphosphate reductase